MDLYKRTTIAGQYMVMVVVTKVSTVTAQVEEVVFLEEFLEEEEIAIMAEEELIAVGHSVKYAAK